MHSRVQAEDTSHICGESTANKSLLNEDEAEEGERCKCYMSSCQHFTSMTNGTFCSDQDVPCGLSSVGKYHVAKSCT